MNYWLHRISHHAEISHPLLEQNILSIGFSDFASQSFIDSVLNGKSEMERWKAIENAFGDIWGIQPRTRHNLWRFIEGFKKGDIVLVPTSGVFSLYEILSNKPKPIGSLEIDSLEDWNGNELKIYDGFIHRNNKAIDLGFYWEVKPIEKAISRKDYADAALTRRMKIRSTNAWITSLKDNIDNALNGYRLKKPINIHSKIIDLTILPILTILRNELNPDKLENLVKWYFEKIGASDVYIPPKNEREKSGDADIIATFEQIKVIIYVQVKFHEGNTSAWAAQQIIDYKNKQEELNEQDDDVMDDDYSRISWVVSTADNYTDNCIKLSKQERVQLINGEKFCQMLIEAGILDINKAF